VIGQVYTAADVTADVDVACDVCIVGSGAGGAVLAAGLVARGLRVVLLEEGGHHTKADFDLQESTAYPMLYQDRGARSTSDLAITILQGRSVGGGTTVNWATCFRTPRRILEHWEQVHHLEGVDADTLAPHFEAVEARLHIGPWPEEAANANNRVLLDGCRALGWEATPLRRNVKGCANSGYCGLGCPVDGKQAMGLTYLADALAGGLQLYANTRALRFEVLGDRVTAVRGQVMALGAGAPAGPSITVRPKVAVSSAGAINSPALLLRSGLDRNDRVGRRTFLHPAVVLPGVYDHVIDGFRGAPQSIGSHQFVDRGPDHVGFFLETPPLQPMLASIASTAFGARQRDDMLELRHLSALIAITVDGLLRGDEGGRVTVRADGRPRVDYPVLPYLAEAFRFAHDVMARIHLAAGAREARSGHPSPIFVRSEADLHELGRAPYGALEHNIFSAHQMGGCAMGMDPAGSVVDAHFRHHHVPNLFVVDGSVLPTALGVNPSETIYALARLATDSVAGAVA
jgi:choline dehydrogenase-like flavoprotein